ncbi:uncharacterized protein DSM5745_05737 [Aspergillus mulundensis]|uniref:Uncharacterized protein n=1 Tax=Aspergillus mulundensis TaxID=1810919 RepID=A0A3D8RXX8_9EURO|nr:hypothetical protein DSM5745_05737 [Aspergillus mulundensis]RDW78885.1 hypothetical protein DSM5745_05737 [Aspergillus mulundensis]
MPNNENPMAADNDDSAECAFLADLTPSLLPHYQYRGPQQFIQDYEHARETTMESTEWFLLEGLPRDAFEQHFCLAETSPFRNWSAYSSSLNRLVARMPREAHEIATSTFLELITEAQIAMGLRRSLRSLLATTAYQGGDAKQADNAWIPAHTPIGRRRTRFDQINADPAQGRPWPSAVLEVGLSDSESERKLKGDVRWWLRASSAEVRLVFTININRTRPELVIESWVPHPHRDGGRLDSTVTIEKDEDGRVTVRGAPLVISFERLFLRAPDGEREGDIEIEEGDLQDLAEAVWESQGF